MMTVLNSQGGKVSVFMLVFFLFIFPPFIYSQSVILLVVRPQLVTYQQLEMDYFNLLYLVVGLD